MVADLHDRADVAHLVETFYRRAFADDLIGVIFTEVARMDLDHHLPIMCDFWETVLFRAGSYRRNALAMHVALHARAPLTAEHFQRWLELWHSTVDELFAGEKAEVAKIQSTRIAGSMLRRLEGGSGSQFATIRRRDRHATRPGAGL